MRPGSRGGGEPSQNLLSHHHLTTNSSLPLLSHFSPSAEPVALARRSLPPHTHTHTPHTRTAHTQPPHSGAPASSPICILPCSGFSFNMQVFPQGRGRGGYSGGDMMRRKRYGKNKYFWSVNLTFFYLLKISLAYSILSV